MSSSGKTTVEFNDAFFSSIMRSAGVRNLCEHKAQQVLSTARQTAPVDTGAYRDGLTVKKVAHAARDTYLVVGTDPKTLLVESKTGNLARALKAAK